jgi:uncharacterized membrane protein
VSRRLAGILGFALFVSLAANVFLGSVAAGRWLSEPPKRERTSTGLQRELRGMVEELPEAQRRPLIERWDAYRATDRQTRERYATVRQQVQQAMMAEPFDRAALEAAFAELRRTAQEKYGEMHTLMADTVAALPADQRRAFAEESARRYARREAEREAAEEARR